MSLKHAGYYQSKIEMVKSEEVETRKIRIMKEQTIILHFIAKEIDQKVSKGKEKIFINLTHIQNEINETNPENKFYYEIYSFNFLYSEDLKDLLWYLGQMGFKAKAQRNNRGNKGRDEVDSVQLLIDMGI